MRRLTITVTLAAGLAASQPAVAHAPRQVGSTAYCLHGRMADGTFVRPGSVASNDYRLGTKLTIRPSPTGRRRFVVRDRIGHGTQLDFWTSGCSAAVNWGRRTVSIKVGWHR